MTRSAAARPARWWVLAALVGLAVAAAALASLDVTMGARLDPVRHTLSDYAHLTPGAMLLTTSAAGLAAAILAIIGGVAAAGLPGTGRVTVPLGGAVIGLLAQSLFRTDHPGHPISATGEVHRWSVALAYVSLLVGARALTRHLPGHPPRRRVARLTVLSLAASTLMLLSYLPVLIPTLPGVGGSTVIGLTQRLLVAADLALLVGLAFALPHLHAAPAG